MMLWLSGDIHHLVGAYGLIVRKPVLCKRQIWMNEVYTGNWIYIGVEASAHFYEYAEQLPQVLVGFHAPSKITSLIKASYKRIVNRVWDDPVVSGLTFHC